jgi:MFS family permease
MPAPFTKAAWIRLAVLLIVVQLFALGLLGALIIDQQRNLLLDLAASRIAVLTGDIDLAVRTGQQNGLSLAEEQTLQPLVLRLKSALPEIRSAEIFSLGAGAEKVLYATDEERIGAAAGAHAVALSRRNPALWRESGADGLIEAGRQLQDEHDRPIGGYAVVFDGSAYAAQAMKARAAFLPAVAAAMAGAAFLTALCLALLALRPVAGRLRRIALGHQIFAAALLTMLGTSVALALHATQLFSAELQPALETKAGTVAGFLQSKLLRAVDLGIPFKRLTGIDEYFADTLAEHREIGALRLVAADGGIIAQAGSVNPAAALSQAGRGLVRSDFTASDGAAARIEVVTDPDHVARSMRAIVADMGIVLLVALIVFNESLQAMLARLPAAGAGLETQPAAQSAAGSRLAALRLPLFLFILTEELTRSFLPLHMRDLAAASAVTGFGGITAAASVPMTVYMLFFALATPFSGALVDRHGATRVFAAGALLAAAGFGWAGITTGYWQFTATRALCATGYALATMACQRLILSDTDASTRAQGLALLIGAVGIAAICGTSIGGVLAERAGPPAVFALSAVVSLLAFGLFARLRQPDRAQGTNEPPFAWRDIGRLLGHRRFAAVMLAAAIPAKIVLAGFLFYLVPLALAASGYAPAAIGRAVMIYFILVAFITPVASRISDRYRLRWSLVIAGGGVIGLGGLAGWLSGVIGSDAAVIAGIAMLGIGTGLSAASLQALANEVGTTDGKIGQITVAVVFRTIERLGSAIGPILAGMLLGWWAFGSVMAGIGCLILATTLVLALIFGRKRYA